MAHDGNTVMRASVEEPISGSPPFHYRLPSEIFAFGQRLPS